MQPNIIERVWRQDKLVNVDVLNGFTFTDEEEAHRFIISGKNVNTPVSISGAITANFKNADGVLVPLTGTIEDGKAVVVLSRECYAVEGPFSLMIFADTVCIYAAIANVINSSGEVIVYPTATVPSVQELIEEVQDVIASIPQDYSVLNQSVIDLKSAFIEKSIEEYGTINVGTLTSGKYIKQADGWTANSSAWSITDFLPIVSGSKLLMTCPLTNNSTQLQYVASVAFYTTNSYSNFKSSQPVQSGALGDVKWVVYDVPNDATHFKASIYTASASNYKYINILPTSENIKTNTASITELNGLYTYDGTFTSSGQILNTGIAAKNGHVYTITATYTADDFSNGQINIFSNGSGGSANYVAVLPDLKPRDFICTVDGNLCLYNIFGYTGNVAVEIAENVARTNQRAGVTYYVGQYERETSLTALLLKLKDNKTQKTIIIRGGDYDVFSEYKALQQSGDLPAVPSSDYDPVTDYIQYNVFIPDNTHIIGEGLVRLNYMPTIAQTTANEAKTLSPINVAGTMTLENIEINCKNGRYCIHDDPMQNPAYNGAIKKYINVRCTKYTNDDANYGTPHNFGCGVSRAMRYEFDNCYFESKSSSSSARTLYFHDRSVVGGVTLQEKMSSNIVIKNTIAKTASGNLGIYFGNIGATGLNIRVDIDSSWTNGNIVSADEGSAGTTGNNANSFNIRTLLSKYNSIIIQDANNVYPPQEFGLE